MQSAIWQFRTRTGRYLQEDNPGEPVLALSEAVRECRAAISVSADVQEMAFNKYYPARIFVHQQRPPLSVREDIKKKTERQRDRADKKSMTTKDRSTQNKVSPEDPESQENEGEETLDNENVLDPEDPEYLPIAIDNHYSPMSPENYVRLRLVNMLRMYRKRLPR